MRRLVLILLALVATLPAHAVEVRVAAPALERTLRNQVFNQPGPKGKDDHRRYLRGTPTTGCAVYADDPHVTFRHTENEEDRIVVDVKTHARVGFGKSCFGLTLTFDSRVSFIPQAEGESVGFRDARIEHLSSNKEVDLLLEPFLANKLPSEMKLNAAGMLRTLLVRAPDSTGYTVTLTTLQIHTMHLEGDALLVDLYAAVRVD